MCFVLLSLTLKWVLAAYEEMLGVEYALSKLDLVAIPDFQAGAMENWGLITFRETDILVPANVSEASSARSPSTCAIDRRSCGL